MQMSKPWVSEALNHFCDDVLGRFDFENTSVLIDSIEQLASENRHIHEHDCINLNPATNIMNPKAEILLASGLGTRPSLGTPGGKYEMGLEAVEQIEVLCSALACEVFSSKYAEIRVGSGALSNLYSFMATCKPGDNIIVPPASIGGHVTHHKDGAAGLFGLSIHQAADDRQHYTFDLEKLHTQVQQLKPKLITIGGSLNLLPHPIAKIRQIADEVGAYVLFDAAHQCGMFAGGHWPNPLNEGAHLMTMSTYKSLGGPPSGLVVSNDAELMEKIDAIAFPGLTANFDVAKSAALAVSLLDWREYGDAYARAMVDASQALANALQSEGLPTFKVIENNHEIATTSHQFALEAGAFGGGQKMARLLRRANLLSCGIGLPIDGVDGDMNGLRFGTPEIVRTGMKPHHMSKLAGFISDSLLKRRPQSKIAADVSVFRQEFGELHFICQS
ncbi:MAG: aminotransferase class I/II-fold pyridoxal phosphate-dependent enzyme [Gammaproteobacteria bacterium]|nr:aminotransferase class I/II-fold pyridoxal phosphate-dependent enzyme [Gammaproteobacteria bacterium]